MTPRTLSPQSNPKVDTLYFEGVFLLWGQENLTTLKRTIVGNRALKMGQGWVFQHDNDVKHMAKATKE